MQHHLAAVPLATRRPSPPNPPMADVQYGRDQQQPPSHAAVKAVAAATAGGSMLVLSGLTLAATVIGLAVATPLLVIFSPVLVPAAIAAALVAAGFLTSGGLGMAALSVLSWMYKYLTGKQPPGADQLEEARRRVTARVREFKDQTTAH